MLILTNLRVVNERPLKNDNLLVMISNDLINKWLSEGLITKEQSEKMLADINRDTKEKKSDKLISLMATIGAVLLGLGFILFIASNWQKISSIQKVLLLEGSTFIVSFAGYYIGYEKKSLPKVGKSLLFLGSILFGATIILISQIYNVQANHHIVILLWLLGIMPLAYILNSLAITGLTVVLLYLWVGVYLSTFTLDRIGDVEKLIIFYYGFSIILFEAGALHFFREGIKKVGYIYRMFSLFIILCMSYLFTFKFCPEHFIRIAKDHSVEYKSDLYNMVLYISSLAIACIIFNLIFNPTKSKTYILEQGTSLALIGVVLILFIDPYLSVSLFHVLFNTVFVATVFIIIYVGFDKKNHKVVDLGLLFFGLFILAKYFDFFYRLLPRSIFFMVGGAILIGGGMFLESKRKEIKHKFIGDLNEG